MSLTSPAESPAAASPLINAPPGFLAGPVVPTLLRLALPTIVVLVVQTMVGVIETYFIGFLGHGGARGHCTGFPGPNADADDVEWRHGRRRGFGGGAGDRRGPPHGCRGAGLACGRSRWRVWRRLHRRGNRRRAMALSRDGRHGRNACRGIDLFQHCLRRINSGLDHGPALGGASRRRQCEGPGAGDARRRRHPRAVVARLDLRLGPVSATGHRRWRRRGRHLLSAGGRDVGRLHALQPKPAQADHHAAQPPAVRRYFGGRPAVGHRHRPVKPHGGVRYRSCRAFRRRRDRRLRHRLASGLSADPAAVRARHRPRHHGWYQCRRGSRWPGRAASRGPAPPSPSP